MRPTIVFAAVAGLAMVSGGVGAEPSGGAKSAATTNPAVAAASSDGSVVLDDTTVWRQFQMSGSHHIRSADSNLFPGRIGYSSGSFGPTSSPIKGPASGSACRHAGKDGESAGAASSNTTFCGEMSQLPPADWTSLAMDDTVWPRVFLPQPVPSGWWISNQSDQLDSYNPYDTVLFLTRTRFEVKDPSLVKACTLSLDYWGGVVVYVNGQEVARGHMPGKKSDLASPATDYPVEAFLTPQGKVLLTDDEKNPDRLALRNRQLRDVKIPASVLRKGVNVLAVETHAAPVNARVFVDGYSAANQGWPPVGLLNARLTVSPAGVAAPNRSRPKGIQVWNCGASETLSVSDYGNPADPLQPILIRAPRNGVFSGRLMVGSDQAIKGLKVTVGDLARLRKSSSSSAKRSSSSNAGVDDEDEGVGGAKIPSSAVRVRYAVAAQEGKSWVGPNRFDGLFDVIPAEIPVAGTKPQGVSLYHLRAEPKPLVPGAVAPLWFTVRVPRDVPPGLYEGQVSISADGLAPIAVPLRVEVCAWTIPDPKDFRVQNFLYHAEEAVARYYGVTNYSARHLELVGKALAIVAEANSRQVQANLACDFFFSPGANPESLVRWIKQPDGSFKHDFTNFDRYLDMVVKYVGKPNTLRLNCWGTGGMNGGPGGGGEVSVFDPATGKLERMPNQFTEAFWRPVLSEVLKKLKARDLLGDTTLGYNSQYPLPDPTLVDMAHKLWPEGEWSFTAHSGAEGMKFRGTDTNVAMIVRHSDGVWAQGPTGKLPPLWMLDKPRRNTFCNTARSTVRDVSPLRDYRRFVEICAVSKGYDGLSEFGVDLFPMKRPIGGYALSPAGRGTGGLMQSSFVAILYPGPDGPVATERFEMFREGVELCEAVLFVQRAVADKKLSADLQQRSARYLAARGGNLRNDFVARFIPSEEDAKLLGLADEVARELASGKK